MKREMALNKMLKVVVVATLVLVIMQYYFYRVRENKIREANEAYIAEQALLEAAL